MSVALPFGGRFHLLVQVLVYVVATFELEISKLELRGI